MSSKPTAKSKALPVAEPSLAVSYSWQASQWLHVSDLVVAKRLPHALLLAGPAGVGKRRFALSLAQALMCERAAETQPLTACGQCRQCQLNLAGTHPDIKQLQPEEKARQIKVDQIRGLGNFLAQTAQQGGYKITLLAPAEAMNVNAANALLKNLEEPGANTLLLLITDSAGSLLPTIRSRCQRIDFPVPAKNDTLPWLTAQVASEEEAVELLSACSGRPLAALQLLESGSLDRRRALDLELFAMLTGRRSALALAEHWKDHELLELVYWMRLKLEAVVRAQQAGCELEPRWQPLVAAGSPVIYRLLDLLASLSAKLNSGANPNKQLALEDLLLRCCEILRKYCQ